MALFEAGRRKPKNQAAPAAEGKTDPSPVNANAALAVIADWVGKMIGPAELWVMPRLVNIAEATDACDRAGRVDAGTQPFDKYTEHPRLSLQHAIVPALMGLLPLLGIRARDILAAYKNGTLSTRPKPIPATVWNKAISPLTWLLLAVGALIEMWLGAQLWERLISADDTWSWIVGLVWGLVIAAGMIVIARLMWEHSPGLLQERGLLIAATLAAVFGFGLAVYAFALAGGAETDPTGGIEGGSTAGASTGSDGLAVNWVFALVYFGAMGFIGAMLVFAHFRDMNQEAKERQRAKREAWSHVLSPEDQLKLAIELLEACLTLVHQAMTVIQAMTSAYVGGARMVLPPELNSLWDSSKLETLKIEDPAWTSDIRNEIEILKGLLGQRHDGAPALNPVS